jgi:hypothetical protein
MGNLPEQPVFILQLTFVVEFLFILTGLWFVNNFKQKSWYVAKTGLRLLRFSLSWRTDNYANDLYKFLSPSGPTLNEVAQKSKFLNSFIIIKYIPL